VTADAGAVAAALAAALGRPVAASPQALHSGGPLHAVYRWPTAAGPVFVKLGAAADAPLLAAEAEGLGRLAAAGALRVPAVLGQGIAGASAWLALEWLVLAAPTAASERALGERLAAQHRITGPRFGYPADNFIGRTPQPNGWCDDCPGFVATRRLAAQLALAAPRGPAPLVERGARLIELVGAFYAGYRPAPSLLHGDLWGGNHGALGDGTPVVYDPAPYFGDREADLAMTRLFGGFGAAFYAAYDGSWPLDAGAGARLELHNLYHVLNHWHLFGGGYGRAALAMIDRLLAAARG
jgi:fructosamine-3-kinase